MSEVSRRHVLTVVLEIERLEVTSRDWRDAAVFVSLLSDIGQQRTENGWSYPSCVLCPLSSAKGL
jgi:hypothetical protein